MKDRMIAKTLEQLHTVNWQEKIERSFMDRESQVSYWKLVMHRLEALGI